jgi:hypothetical protein
MAIEKAPAPLEAPVRCDDLPCALRSLDLLIHDIQIMSLRHAVGENSSKRSVKGLAQPKAPA